MYLRTTSSDTVSGNPGIIQNFNAKVADRNTRSIPHAKQISHNDIDTNTSGYIIGKY